MAFQGFGEAHWQLVMHGSSGYGVMRLLEVCCRGVAGKMIIFKGSSSLARCGFPELYFLGHKLRGLNGGVSLPAKCVLCCSLVELLVTISLQENHKVWGEAGSCVGGEFLFSVCELSLQFHYTGHLLQE